MAKRDAGMLSIDERATYKQAKKLLNQYRLLENVSQQQATSKTGHEASETITAINETIEKMNIPEYQSTIRLLFIERKPHIEVANELAISIRTLFDYQVKALVEFATLYQLSDLIVWR